MARLVQYAENGLITQNFHMGIETIDHNCKQCNKEEKLAYKGEKEAARQYREIMRSKWK